MVKRKLLSIVILALSGTFFVAGQGFSQEKASQPETNQGTKLQQEWENAESLMMATGSRSSKEMLPDPLGKDSKEQVSDDGQHGDGQGDLGSQEPSVQGMRPASPASNLRPADPAQTMRPASPASNLRPADPAQTMRPRTPAQIMRPASP